MRVRAVIRSPSRALTAQLAEHACVSSVRRVARFVGERAALFVYGAAVLFVFLFHLRFHEPWRDEAQALLIARALTFGNAMEVLRYEVHPPLLHVLMKVLDRVTGPPLTLAIVSALNTAVLLYGTHALLRVLARTRRSAIALTCLLCCTYFYTYELGIVARAYGLGLGLCFLMMARFQQALETGAWRPLILGSCAAALSVLTSAVAAVFVAVALVVYPLAFLVARPKQVGRLVALGLCAPPLLLVREITKPMPNRSRQFEPIATVARTWEANWNDTKHWLDLVFGAGTTNGWWKTAVPTELVDFASEATKWAVVAFVVLHAVRLVREWRTSLFIPLTALLQVVAFFYLIFYRDIHPDYRHWTFVMANVAVVIGGMCLVGGDPTRLVYWLRRFSLAFLLPWLGVQALVLYGNVSQDASYPFSLTKRFAAMLPHGARVIVTGETDGTSIHYWRPDVVTRSPYHSGRYFTYVRWDAGQRDTVPMKGLVAEECGRSTQDAVYVFGATNDIPPACLTPMYPAYDAKRARTDEYARGWSVKCSCLRK